MIHATATGSGVHLFTSSLSPTGQCAIFAVADGAVGVCDAEPEAGVGDRFGAGAHADSGDLGRASVQPMDSVTCPTVAVEVAPLVGGHVTEARPVTDVIYQKSVVDALAAALEQWRSDWKQ